MVTIWGGNLNLRLVDDRKVWCRSECGIWSMVQGSTVKVQAIDIDKVVDGVDVGVGMDVIGKLAGVTVGKKRVKFSNRCTACYEYGEAEEGCECDKTCVKRENIDATLKMRTSGPDSMAHDKRQSSSRWEKPKCCKTG